MFRCKWKMTLPVIGDLFIDLVGDDEQIVFDGNRRDKSKLVPCEHLSSRVVRRVEHQLIAVQMPLTVTLAQREIDRSESKHAGLSRIHLMKRLEDDDAIAAVARPGEDGGQPLGGTQHNRCLRLRVGAESPPTCGVVGDRVSKLG